MDEINHYALLVDGLLYMVVLENTDPVFARRIHKWQKAVHESLDTWQKCSEVPLRLKLKLQEELGGIMADYAAIQNAKTERIMHDAKGRKHIETHGRFESRS